MTITKAIEHFKWKLSNKWNPTETDVEALNSIVTFVNNKHNIQIKENILFAKLYVFGLSYFINHYNSSVYCMETQKELHKLLDKPLSVFIERFKDNLNNKDIELLYEHHGLDIKHPKEYTEEENKKIEEILKNRKQWEYKEVHDKLLSQINHAINEFQ